LFKRLLVILFYFIVGHVSSQTIIKIIPPENSMSDYRLEKLQDTVFIEIGHSDDMGKTYGYYYRLKSNVPDGEYLVYFHDLLNLSAFIKNSQKDSIWTKYNSSGTPISIITYKNGLIHGEMITFYNSGSVHTICNYVNNQISGPAMTFYESGKIKYITYYYNSEQLNQEIYDEDGKYLYDVKPQELNKIH